MKRMIMSSVQHTHDKTRLRCNPSTEGYSVVDVTNQLWRFKNHKVIVSKSKTLTEVSNMVKLTKETKWIDWGPSFMNYLYNIKGRYDIAHFILYQGA